MIKKISILSLIFITTMLCCVISVNTALALDNNAIPTGQNVIAGSANFNTPATGQLNVTQTSNRAVIEWNSFNIGNTAKVEFMQPSASSVAVNRITGNSGDPTQILGSLKSNGQVMVLDPNGIFFGAGSTIDVGGLIASTGNINDANFMTGTNDITLSNIDGDGIITNNTTINAKDGGLVALVAPHVINNGVINARLGKVVLAAGDKVTLDLFGDGLYEIAADDALQDALIENHGTIQADGGIASLSVAATRKALSTVINMDGVIQVNHVGLNNGKIVLSASGVDRIVDHSGTITASRADVDITADRFDLNTDLIMGSGKTFIKARSANLNAEFLDTLGNRLDRSQLNGDVNLATIKSNKASIQQGIDISSYGVYVLNDNYAENLDIYKSILLQGERSDAPNLTGTNSNSAIIDITANDVSIDNFNLSGKNAKTGIKIDQFDRATVKGVNFLSGLTTGISVTNSNDSVITRGVFDKVTTAILAKNSQNIVIGSNEINSAQTAMNLQNTNNALIRGNILNDTSTGLKLSKSNNVRMHWNEMTNVKYGALIDNSQNFDAYGNQFGGTSSYALKVKNSNNATIRYNWIKDQNKNGIYIEKSQNATVKDNIFLSVDKDGNKVIKKNRAQGMAIYLKNTSNATISNNTIDDLYSYGIKLNGAKNTNILDNFVSNNKYGLYGYGSKNGAILLNDNEFKNNQIGAYFKSGKITFNGINKFINGDVGLRIETNKATITGNDLGQSVFSGQKKYFIELKNKALSKNRSVVIDATQSVFNGKGGGTPLSAQDILTIEKQIKDHDDDKSLGQIFIGNPTF